MKKLLAPACIALSLAGVAVPSAASAASVSYEGEWSVDCGRSGYQCFWTFEKTGKGAYDAYFTAAELMDVGIKRCTDAASGKASGKGLDMEMGHGGYRLSAVPAKDGSLILKPVGGWRQDCAGFNMFGTLSPIGD